MKLGRRVSEWWFAPAPLARIAVFRTLVYGFIFVDVFVSASWVAKHAHLPGELYKPLFLGRLLNLATPSFALVTGVQVLLLLAAALAISGRWPRSAGIAVAVLYLEWMFIAMSYGKVDHDRVAFLVALAVLPTVGRSRFRDETEDEGAGWALSAVQVAVVATYFLAAFAKFRFGGLDWVNGATLTRAVLRRGTFLADPFLLENSWILHMSQYGIIVFELASPLMLLRNRFSRAFVIVALIFHLITYASITIIFLPHIVALTSFLPLERLQLRRRKLVTSGGRSEPP